MERPFTVICLRDEQIVRVEELEFVSLRGLELERLGPDGYLETIAAYDPGPHSWYGFADCERYDKITITVKPLRRLLAESLDAQNHIVSSRHLSGARGLRLDAAGGPRLLFIDEANQLSDAHADPETGLWRPSVDSRLGFDNLRFRTPALFQSTGAIGPRLRASALAERHLMISQPAPTLSV